jgi:integrase
MFTTQFVQTLKAAGVTTVTLPTTLPVDFHSFRRAFNTALAEAGVNVQHAMHLAGHTSPLVHQRYVMSTATMRSIPAAALPLRAIGMISRGRESSQVVMIR